MRKIAFRIPSGTTSEIRVYDLLGTTPISKTKTVYRTPTLNFICEMVDDPDWGELDQWYMCAANSNTIVSKVKKVPVPEEELGW